MHISLPDRHNVANRFYLQTFLSEQVLSMILITFVSCALLVARDVQYQIYHASKFL